MTRRFFPLALTLSALIPATARSGAPAALPRLNAASAVSLLTNTSFDSLAGALRGYLVQNLPPQLYEASPGWGNTKLVTRGVKWRGQGLEVHPERIRIPKNDGVWRKIQFMGDNLKDTLILDIRTVQNEQPGRITFDVFVSFDAHLVVCQQNWEAGVKLYDGDFRARMRVKLLLSCEATARLESTGGLVPDAIVRLRATHARLEYDNFVAEHVAGVGGELAKILGDLGRGGLKQWHPSLESEVLAKADAAIVKAADTKDVRLSLTRLLKVK